MGRWKKEINSRRAGAGYFLAQSKRPKFDPSEYIENRAIKTPKAAQKLRREWEAWMKDLSSSKHAVVSELAKTARPMTATDLDKYYKSRVVANRALAVLEASSEQLGDADNELSSSLREDHRKR
jgi:hypothetical protein